MRVESLCCRSPLNDNTHTLPARAVLMLMSGELQRRCFREGGNAVLLRIWCMWSTCGQWFCW